jgi:hypothetical protein
MKHQNHPSIIYFTNNFFSLSTILLLFHSLADGKKVDIHSAIEFHAVAAVAAARTRWKRAEVSFQVISYGNIFILTRQMINFNKTLIINQYGKYRT